MCLNIFTPLFLAFVLFGAVVVGDCDGLQSQPRGRAAEPAPARGGGGEGGRSQGRLRPGLPLRQGREEHRRSLQQDRKCHLRSRFLFPMYY